MNLKHLLSDKFVEFSSQVADVHGRIKDLKSKFQSEMKALTDEAEGLSVEFQAWQKEQDTPTADKTVKAPVKEEKPVAPSQVAAQRSNTRQEG